jgi:hypothetical protein
MTTHPDELVARSLDGDLTRAEQLAVNAHLATCARCRALAADLRRVDPLIARHEEVDTVPTFDPHIRHAGIAWLWAPIALAAAIVAATVVAMPRDEGVARPSVIPSASASPSATTPPSPIATSPASPSPSGADCAAGRIGDITACPSRAAVGDTVAVEGRSCNYPGANTELYFGTTGQFGQPSQGTYGAVKVASAPTTADGSFSAAVKIPSRIDSIQGEGGGDVRTGVYAVYSLPPSCAVDVTVTAAASGTSDWAGFYLRATTVTPGADLEARPLTLMEADGTFPGRIVDATTAWRAVGDWSPDGRSVLAFAKNGDVYVVSPGGQPRRVTNSERGFWAWYDDRTIYSIRPGASQNELVRVSVADGSLVATRALPRDVLEGTLAPGGRYLAYVIGGGDGLGSTFVYDLSDGSSRMVAVGMVSRGWLDGQRLVAWSGSRVDVVTMPTASHTTVFANESLSAFVSAEPPAILVVDRSEQIWSVKDDGTRSPAPGPVVSGSPRAVGGSGFPTSLTRDGRAIAFDLMLSRYPSAPTLYRSGVRSLVTGSLSYACQEDCTSLRVR